MHSGYMALGMECPKCGKDAMFLSSKILTGSDGLQCGVLVLLCDNCKHQEPSDEEALKKAREEFQNELPRAD